mmetsp:Transcript_19859/g.31214  ORF Transcript_19859/g.31214 Transcript_19859/m.31214 type:complete len:327 (-) Transcript_19859:200-1180(-)
MNLSVTVLLSLLCTAPASGRRLGREHQGHYGKSAKSAKTPDSPPDSGEGARSFGELETSSISGTYAMVLETGANLVSALGVVDYDGDGHLSGSIRFNELDEDNSPDRFLTTSDITGTYSLESPGLGNQEIVFDGNADSAVPAGLLVTKAEGTNVHSLDGNFLVPSEAVPGALTRFTMTQRVSNFHTNSLNGNYAFQIIGGANMGYGFGFINFDGVEGDGTFTGQMRGNAPASDSERFLFETALTGTYEVEHHGFTTLQLTFADFPEFPVFPITALIVHANGSQGLSLRGNFEIPSPVLAAMGLPSLVRTQLDYLGPAGMTEVSKTQ